MSAYNQFVNLDPVIITKLQRVWLGPAVNYIHKDSSGAVLREVLFEIDQENYDKAAKRLTGAEGEIVSGDKVYVLPNCRIPVFKIQDYLKESGAVITNDVKEATKIIGHDKVIEDAGYQAGGSVMLINESEVLYSDKYQTPKIYGFSPEQQDEADIGNKEKFQRFLDGVEIICEISAERTMMSAAAINGTCSTYNFHAKERKRYITPTGALVMYYHILNKISIISENVIFEKIGKPVALDEDSYKSVLDMLGSKDESNHKMGAEILANCDIEKSLFWIWKLAREKQWVISGLSRFKNIRLFIRMSKWSELGRMDSEEFAEYLHKRNMLTKEYFGELFPDVAKKYSNVLESSMLTLTVEPSQKYHTFANGQKVIYTKESLEQDKIYDEDPVQDILPEE